MSSPGASCVQSRFRVTPIPETSPGRTAALCAFASADGARDAAPAAVAPACNRLLRVGEASFLSVGRILVLRRLSALDSLSHGIWLDPCATICAAHVPDDWYAARPRTKCSRALAPEGWARCSARATSPLGREVAIKALPDAFAADPDRTARFEREARVLASLNHSNIAAIYGLERAEAVTFIVLELVPGETLADRLAHGACLSTQVLLIAKQIVDALDAAHSSGVVALLI